MFSFRLSDSLALAREILSRQTEKALPAWDQVAHAWDQAKGRLVNAICPETGRWSVPWVHQPSAAERLTALRGALSAVHSLQPREYQDSPNLDERYQGPALPALPLLSFRESLVCADVAEDKVSADSPLLSLEKAIKRGMKLSRALGALIRSTGRTNDDAAQTAEQVFSKAAVLPRKGTIVLSANPLDILLQSECTAAWTSCHSFEGCHCAGPQQYLAADCTVVAYYYEETRPWYGTQLPCKIMRQLVHIDTSHSSAALMRIYPRPDILPDDVMQTVRREVARLLLILRDGDCRDAPHWVHADATDGTVSGHELAYPDPVTSCVQLVGGKDNRPRCALPRRVPCAECGDYLDECDKLVCQECFDNWAYECNSCASGLDEDDVRTQPDTGEIFCQRCWSANWFECAGCDDTFPRDDSHSADGDAYCKECFADRYTECADCGDTWRASDCQGEDDILYCPSCWPEEEHRRALCLRLVSSPLYQRVATGHERHALAQRWTASFGIASDRLTDLLALSEEAYESTNHTTTIERTVS